MKQFKNYDGPKRYYYYESSLRRTLVLNNITGQRENSHPFTIDY